MAASRSYASQGRPFPAFCCKQRATRKPTYEKLSAWGRFAQFADRQRPGPNHHAPPRISVRPCCHHLWSTSPLLTAVRFRIPGARQRNGRRVRRWGRLAQFPGNQGTRRAVHTSIISAEVWRTNVASLSRKTRIWATWVAPHLLHYDELSLKLVPFVWRTAARSVCLRRSLRPFQGEAESLHLRLQGQ